MTWRTYKIYGRPWQDVTFAVGEVVFLVALVPLLWTHTQVPLYTGLSTALMLYAFGVCQFSYQNWITLVLGVTTATIWLLLGLGVHL